MSPENVEVVRGVRMPVNVPSEKTWRTLDERIFVLFPALFRALAFAWSRLPPRSALRRALTAHNFRQAYEAAIEGISTCFFSALTKKSRSNSMKAPFVACFHLTW
jgi:hypothetical protein